MKRFLLAGVAFTALATMSIEANAGPVVSNQWYTGRFGDVDPPTEASVGNVLTGPAFTSAQGVHGPVQGVGTYGAADPGFADASDAPTGTSWTITLTYGGTLTVVDSEQSGDRFYMTDSQDTLGLTSEPVAFAISSLDCSINISCALADSTNFSFANFSLTPGDHTFSGTLAQAGGGGAGDFHFIVQANAAPSDVPEPASLALLGVGMVGLAALRRRAKR